MDSTEPDGARLGEHDGREAHVLAGDRDLRDPCPAGPAPEPRHLQQRGGRLGHLP